MENTEINSLENSMDKNHIEGRYEDETYHAHVAARKISFTIPQKDRLAAAAFPKPDSYLSIVDFGAVPNDASDSLPAIKRCIAAAKEQQMGVYIPEGTFNFSNLIVLDGVSMQGAGPGFSVLNSTNLAHQAVKLEGSEIRLSNLMLTTVAPPIRLQTDESARIVVSHVDDFVIENIEIYGGSSAGIFLEYSARGIIRNNSIFDTKADAIHNTRCTSFIQIYNNIIRNNGDDMIAVVSYRKDGGCCHHISIANNDISGNFWGRGITVVGGHDVEILSNRLSDTEFAGIYISGEMAYDTYGVDNVLVKDNRIENCGSATAPGGHGAIHVYANSYPCLNLVFKDNRIINSKCMGIHLNGGKEQDVTFLGNIISDTKREGVYMDTTFSGSAVFKDNTFEKTYTFGLLYNAPVSGSIQIINNIYAGINISGNPDTDAIRIEKGVGILEGIIIKDNVHKETCDYPVQHFLHIETAAENIMFSGNISPCKSFVNGKEE